MLIDKTLYVKKHSVITVIRVITVALLILLPVIFDKSMADEAIIPITEGYMYHHIFVPAIVNSAIGKNIHSININLSFVILNPLFFKVIMINEIKPAKITNAKDGCANRNLK